jgi:hypothetical protein
VSTALFACSLIVTAILTRGGHIPSPFGPAGAARSFFAEHANAVRLNAFLQLGAAIPLGLFTATAVSRLRFLGVNVAGVDIAFFGGVAAAAFSMLSALVQWTIAASGVAAAGGDLHAFHVLFFALGGPGHVAASGLLVAGISISGGLSRVLPRWVMWFGIAIAAVAETSTLTIVTPAAAYLLPLARIPAFAWLICAGALLPRSRAAIRGRTMAAPGGRLQPRTA